MSERYKQVKLYDSFSFCPTCPVDILKGAIYIDTVTNKAVFQLKFINMQEKHIKAIYVQIKGSNDLGQELENKEYQYLDLNVSINQEFGTEQLKDLNNNTIRSIEITLNKVIYADNEVWENKSTVVYDRTSLQCIDKNLLVVAKKKTIEQKIQTDKMYYPTQNDNYWTCVCGTYNSNSKEKCYKCNCNKKIVMDYFNRHTLENDLKQYNEQQEKEKKELQEKIKNTRNKIKKTICKMLMVTIIISIIIFISVISYKQISLYCKYKQAQKYIKNNNYIEAINVLDEIINYKDSKELIKSAKYSQANKYISDNNYIEAIDIFNEIIDYKDSKEIIKSTLEIQRSKQVDSSSISVYRSNRDDECKIIAVKNNGTVVATGKNKYGECNVSDWTDIVSVSTSVNHTVGLKSNGTVVATGNNDNKQCDVSEWKDIVKVVATIRATYGLKSNGTIVSTEEDFENITTWEDIIDIKVSGKLIYGLTSYGKVLKSGQENPRLEVYNNIININMNNLGLVATKVDNTIAKLYVPKMEEYSGTGYLDWKNVIYTNNEIGILGINNTGKILYTTKVQESESIKEWEDLIYVGLYENSHSDVFYYIGITKDGNILTNRKHSIINFDDFTDLKIVTDNRNKIL